MRGMAIVQITWAGWKPAPTLQDLYKFRNGKRERSSGGHVRLRSLHSFHDANLNSSRRHLSYRPFQLVPAVLEFSRRFAVQMMNVQEQVLLPTFWANIAA